MFEVHIQCCFDQNLDSMDSEFSAFYGERFKKDKQKKNRSLMIIIDTFLFQLSYKILYHSHFSVYNYL